MPREHPLTPFEIDNPYASPSVLESELEIGLARCTDWRRGFAMALLWQGIGFTAILFIAIVVRLVLIKDEPIAARLDSVRYSLPAFVGRAIFLGMLFALAAMATYTPAKQIKFSSSLVAILFSNLLWSSALLLLSTPLRWPTPWIPVGYYLTTLGGLWYGGWLILGPLAFTIYLLRSRIATDASH